MSRLETFNAFRNPLARKAALADAQSKRRAEALERQKAVRCIPDDYNPLPGSSESHTQSRQEAFSLSRQGLEDFAEDLTLNDSDSDERHDEEYRSRTNNDANTSAIEISEPQIALPRPKTDREHRKVKRRVCGVYCYFVLCHLLTV